MHYLNESDVKITYIRSQGPGGQNVNKLATAAQLRFNIIDSKLPEDLRIRFLALYGKKITQKGDIIIKASRYRTQERNKKDAMERLLEMLNRAGIVPKARKKTKPTKASKERRLDQKKLMSKRKSLRSGHLD